MNHSAWIWLTHKKFCPSPIWTQRRYRWVVWTTSELLLRTYLFYFIVWFLKIQKIVSMLRLISQKCFVLFKDFWVVKKAENIRISEFLFEKSLKQLISYMGKNIKFCAFFEFPEFNKNIIYYIYFLRSQINAFFIVLTT